MNSQEVERTCVGNTPECEDCHNPQDRCVCGDLDGMPWCERCQSYHHVTAEHITRALETIDITPVGCQTPEGNRRVYEALATIDSANARVADIATQMVDRLAANGQWQSEENDALKAAVAYRRNAYAAFLRAVSGQKGETA